MDKIALDTFLTSLGFDPKAVVRVTAEMGYISVDYVDHDRGLVQRTVLDIRGQG